MKHQRVSTIIFDYDGTLHDSKQIYIPAFKKAYCYLVENGLAVEREWSDEEITQWLGYSKIDMWALFMPKLSSNYQDQASNIIGITMLENTLKGKAKLYDQALEMLSVLKAKGYKLIFLSNCSKEYMQMHTKIFELDQYFDEMICSEQYQFKKSKKEIVKEYFDKHYGKYAIIGDRSQDIEVGELKEVIAVGCSYGYGSEKELSKADIRIDSLRELDQYF